MKWIDLDNSLHTHYKSEQRPGRGRSAAALPATGKNLIFRYEQLPPHKGNNSASIATRSIRRWTCWLEDCADSSSPASGLRHPDLSSVIIFRMKPESGFSYAAH